MPDQNIIKITKRRSDRNEKNTYRFMHIWIVF